MLLIYRNSLIWRMSASGHGLGVIMAIIFLAGEMAGVGVLALPKVDSNVLMNVSIRL